MDISEWIKSSIIFENQIKEHYINFKSDTWTPIHPFKANFKAKSSTLCFCGIPVVESYLYKLDSNYAFYFFVKQNSNLANCISIKFGSHNAETSFEVNNNSFPTAYYWDGKQNIILRKYYNILGKKKYENSYLVIFGNMSFRSLTDLKI